jgi:hypothetical protein
VEAALTEGANETGLDHESILCVRHLALKLPRSPRLAGALRAEASGAARPAGGPVPANANAVLFADRAELLACLARDWCAGEAGAGWWWTVLFPRDDLGAVVRRIWLEDARPVPAALGRLESAGLAFRFLEKLPPRDLALLWQNIVNTFHLPALEAAWDAADLDPPEAAGPDGEPPPWLPWISPAPSLHTKAARVLITAVLLERAPAKLRSGSFARAVRAWRRSDRTRSVPAPDANGDFPLAGDDPAKMKGRPSVPAPVSVPSPPDQEQTPGTELSIPPGLTKAERVAPAAAPDRERLMPANAPKAGDAVQSPLPAFPPLSERAADSRTSEGETGRIHMAKGVPLDSCAASIQPTVALPSPDRPERIVTEWGGTLYLVNVAIALGYYGDFTSPAQPGLALPLWDFLALVGGQMAGEEFADDPLPALFARLSGRAEDEPPGAQFEPPDGESLTRWLDRICHDLQARVLSSLGLGDECDLAALLLNQPARIEVGSTRLDASFSLANHPIALRIAGLDRDPGWVPASGRSLYFHYE